MLRRLVLALPVALLASTVAPAPAAACDCLLPTLEANWEWSTDIFYTRVTKALTVGDKVYYRAQVGRSWKGCHAPGDRVRLVTDASSAACGQTLQVGTTYLITATEVGPGVLEFNDCGYNVPFADLGGDELGFLDDHCPGGQGCCGGSPGDCLPWVGGDSASDFVCPPDAPFDSFGAEPLWPEVDLGEFSPIPDLGALDFGAVQPGEPVTYWELRWTWGFGPGEVIGSGGLAPCASATDPDACAAGWEALGVVGGGFAPGCLPGYCSYYVAVNAGDESWVITDAKSFAGFMAPIDTPEEAILVGLAKGYHWSTGDLSAGGVRESACGWELLLPELVQYCDPVASDRVLLQVTGEGLSKPLGAQAYDIMCGVCI